MEFITINGTSDDRYKHCLHIRTDVFVHEQGVDAALEQDEYDQLATHIVLYLDGEAVGTGRIRLLDTKAKIERVSILKSARNKGLGKRLIQQMESKASDLGASKLSLHSQEHALPFYLNLGYSLVSERFFDAGIPHFAMEKTIKKANG